MTAALAKGGSKTPPPPAAPVKQTPDDAAAELLRTLAATRYGQSDDDQVASVKKLLGFWKSADVTAATKKPIPGLVQWYAERKSSPVALAGIAGLVDLGRDQGAQRLMHVLDMLLQQKDPPADVTAAAFAGMKTMADPDPSVTRLLLALLLQKSDAVVAKAADVFAGYDAAPAVARKGLFESLLPSFEAMAAAAASAADKAAVDRWAAVAPPATGAVNALSHQQFANLAAARKWFTEHGREAGAWK
jgi:hypothetical protein